VLGSSQLIKQETRAWVITADQTGNTWLGRSLVPGSGFYSKIDQKRTNGFKDGRGTGRTVV
jgi:hypothetical protein